MSLKSRMFQSKQARVIALASAGLCLAATAGGVAVAAAPGGANAGHTQAAAIINADTSIVRSKGISSVTSPYAGRFCVRLDPVGLNVNEIIPIATLTTGGYPGQIYVHPGATSECGNRADTLLVVTTNSKDEPENKQFSLIIP
ncbi:hypothetical protein [Streptomyces sp. NPDC056387]|uniref:hypothetical protein n=1 Tax=Streptomyces sp. NPDC056387 TaxID=3345803 RepID=UPI0035DF0E52